MHNYLQLVRLDRKITVPLAQRSLREHLDIILACKARDPEKAVAALSPTSTRRCNATWECSSSTGIR